MKQNRFIKNSAILIIGGFISELLNITTKIVNTRLIGINGVALHALVIPTYQLLINIAMLGFPIATSKIVAEKRYSSKKIIFSLIPVSLAMSIILILLVYFSLPLITKSLHEPKTYYPLLAISIILPFVSISSIIRGYFVGKQKMTQYIVSNTFEQVIRLIIIIIITPHLLKFGIVPAISAIFLVNFISETTSIIILYKNLPKNFRVTKKDLKLDKNIIKEAINVGIPATTSSLVNSIGNFFEPIILMIFLIYFGFSSDFLKYQYGILNGYVFPLLLIPSFFSLAISQALLPTLAEAKAERNLKNIKSKINQGLFISFCFGLVAIILFIGFPEFFLRLLFNTTEGTSYLKFLAPIYLLQYLQAPLLSVLQAINKNSIALLIAISSIIIKFILFILFAYLGFGFNSYLFAIIINIVLVTILYSIVVMKFLNNKS